MVLSQIQMLFRFPNLPVGLLDNTLKGGHVDAPNVTETLPGDRITAHGLWRVTINISVLSPFLPAYIHLRSECRVIQLVFSEALQFGNDFCDRELVVGIVERRAARYRMTG